jgi:hypothetical protein
MNRMLFKSLLAAWCIATLLVSTSAPAAAQYRPLPQSSSGIGGGDVKGEKYHIELSGNLWNPQPDFLFSSEGLGIAGSEIDLDADLGIQQKQMYEARLVLRPAKKHKLRVHYLPMAYTGDAMLKRDIVFNGILYPVTVQVKTDFKWTAYRFTYEYDVIYRERGYLGILLESKYADTSLTLESAISTEFVKARAPIPAAGLVARVYPLSFVSLTGEFTYFKLPDSVDESASFSSVDFDVYGTVNIGHNIGIQAGYRSIDMAFGIDLDSGSIKLKGPYVGGVLRF